MNKYAVALISFFDNDNKVFIELANDELSAMKKAVISFVNEGQEADFMPLLNGSDNPSQLKEALYNCDMAISDALLISQDGSLGNR